jgi:hypothetical protein
MLFQSLRALRLAPGGAGSIWNHLGALVRSTGVAGRCVCGFRTDLKFADVPFSQIIYLLEYEADIGVVLK